MPGVINAHVHYSYDPTTRRRFLVDGVTATCDLGCPLRAPLDLIHGQTVHWIRFTFLDQSPENASMYLYRVDRQGNGDYPWSYNSDVSGGYFTTASPYMELTIDNHNYAYYFVVALGSSAVGNNLCALEVEVIYGNKVYLPLVLKNS